MPPFTARNDAIITVARSISFFFFVGGQCSVTSTVLSLEWPEGTGPTYDALSSSSLTPHHQQKKEEEGVTINWHIRFITFFYYV